MTRNLTLPLLGATMLAAFGATLLLSGGWQAAAAAVSMMTGVVFMSRFVALLIAGEQPQARVPRIEAHPRPAPAPAPEPEPAGAPERRAPILRRPAGMPR